MEQDMINIEGLDDAAVKEIMRIFQRFLRSYNENTEKKSEEWLIAQLEKELPEESVGNIQKIAREITKSINLYDWNLEQLNQNCKKGISKETWLAEKLQDGAKGMAVNCFGNYLSQIDRNLEMANTQMERIILRADGEISQAFNLDGFIAEQYHVNEFNAKAILEQSPYRARVLGPENGGYRKNSVDVVIDNIETGKKGIERYQFKFGKDSQNTIAMLKRGNYKNQRFVVPKEQVSEIKKAFPNKTVTDYIGGTENVKVQSSAYTKEEMKNMQMQVQKSDIQPEINWNSYQAKELALGIGKQAGKVGVFAALMGSGIHVVSKAVSGEKIETNEIVKNALETGSDACVKAAAGGALKVAVEKGILKLIPKETPVGIITTIACVGIENVKVLWKVAKGDLTMSEVQEYMGRNNVSMIAGLGSSAVGAAIGAAVLGWIPLVGPLVGGLIGGAVGYTAGSRIGEKIYEGAKGVVKKGIELVKKGARIASSARKKIKDKWENVIA